MTHGWITLIVFIVIVFIVTGLGTVVATACDKRRARANAQRPIVKIEVKGGDVLALHRSIGAHIEDNRLDLAHQRIMSYADKHNAEETS